MPLRGEPVDLADGPGLVVDEGQVGAEPLAATDGQLLEGPDLPVAALLRVLGQLGLDLVGPEGGETLVEADDDVGQEVVGALRVVTDGDERVGGPDLGPSLGHVEAHGRRAGDDLARVADAGHAALLWS